MLLLLGKPYTDIASNTLRFITLDCLLCWVCFIYYYFSCLGGKNWHEIPLNCLEAADYFFYPDNDLLPDAAYQAMQELYHLFCDVPLTPLPHPQTASAPLLKTLETFTRPPPFIPLPDARRYTPLPAQPAPPVIYTLTSGEAIISTVPSIATQYLCSEELSQPISGAVTEGAAPAVSPRLYVLPEARMQAVVHARALAQAQAVAYRATIQSAQANAQAQARMGRAPGQVPDLKGISAGSFLTSVPPPNYPRHVGKYKHLIFKLYVRYHLRSQREGCDGGAAAAAAQARRIDCIKTIKNYIESVRRLSCCLLYKNSNVKGMNCYSVHWIFVDEKSNKKAKC